MGGFIKYDSESQPRVVAYDDKDVEKTFKDIARNVNVSKKEIEDRSKSNALAKTIVVLQTGWFILQCVSRRIERLPLTLLEIATVAFAGLNIVTYFLWWNKPLDVRCAVEVSADGSRRQVQGTSAGEEVGWWHGLADIPREIIRPLKDSDWSDVTIMLPFFIFQFILGVEGARKHPDRVATFGPRGNQDAVMVIPVVAATMFGAIHLFAWDVYFPTHTEQLLWRLASLSITLSPLLFASLLWVVLATDSSSLITVSRFFMILICVLYASSRFLLLTLALTSLRSLPAGAYQSVHWTQFIPHIY
jgi:hypothetical protein